MKKITICSIFIAFLALLLFMIFFKYSNSIVTESNDLSTSSTKNDVDIDNGLNQKTKDERNSERVSLPLDKLAFEISRKICNEEIAALSNMLEPDVKGVKPGTTIPFDLEIKLPPSQAIEWLKKTSNSKCSSFRKDNAERLFVDFKIDNTNYKTYLNEFNNVLGEYKGFGPYRLITNSLRALEGASPAETESLREAILFSLTTYVNDSSSLIDVNNSLLATEVALEKGLINEPNQVEINMLKEEVKNLFDSSIKETRQLLRTYSPPNMDPNLSIDEMAEILGYDYMKAEQNLQKKEYEKVRQLSGKLLRLLH